MRGEQACIATSAPLVVDTGVTHINIRHGALAGLFAAAIGCAGAGQPPQPQQAPGFAEPITLEAMRRINANEAAQVVPRRIDVVTAGRNDTVQTLAGRMAYGNAQIERFRVLNGLAANAQVVPGEKSKIVVRG